MFPHDMRLQPLEEKSTSSELGDQSSSSHNTSYNKMLPIPKRLTHAYQLGESDAKKLIELYDKKKEENSTTCENSTICREQTMNVLSSFNRDYIDDLFLVENVNDKLRPTELNTNKNYHKQTARCNKIRPKNDYFETVPLKLGEETLLNDSGKKCDLTRTEVSTQHSSVFLPPFEDLERKSIDIQNSEKNIDLQKPRGQSEVSIQCSLRLKNSDQSITESTFFLDDNQTIRKRRLRNVIRKMIYHQRIKTGDSAWQKYINDLKLKHSIISDDNNFNTKNITVSKSMLTASLARKNFNILSVLEDEFSPCSNGEYKHRILDYESSRCVSPLSDFTHKSSRKQSFSRFKISYPPSHTEYGNTKINTLCFPSMMTNDVISKPNEYKSKTLCRNIYDLRKSDFFHTNECINYSRKRKVYDYLNQLRDLSIHEMHTFNKKSSEEIQEQNMKKPDTISSSSSPECDNNETLALNKVENDLQSKTSQTKKLNYEIEKIHNIEKEASETQTSLCEIENKLDKLIDSIHLLMEEVKSSKSSENNDKYKLFASNINNLNPDLKLIKKIMKTKSVPLKTTKEENILHSVGQMLANKEIDLKRLLSPANQKSCEIKFIVSSRTDTKSTNTRMSPQIDSQKHYSQEMEMIKKEKSKNHHLTCDEYPHAVQITVDFLVQDDKEKIINNKIKDQRKIDCNERCRIANSSINTEPLSLHQISKETLRSLISFFPIIEYYWNFLPFPKLNLGHRTQLECDVCNGTFANTADLNRHRQTHSRGSHNTSCFLCNEPIRTKDTRTVKTVIPMPKVFTCQFCGKTFTRAYSKQLHEHSCSENKQQSLEQKSLVVLR